MDINEFVEKFSDVFDDVDNLTLTPETYFKEIDEYSSVTALSIISSSTKTLKL